MNRKKNIVLLVALIIVLTASIVLSKIFVLNNKIIRKEDKIDKLINISKLDKDFMKKYYNDMDELHKKSDLKNALILVSFEETAVVAAPNNTYFLDYKDKFARDRAKK